LSEELDISNVEKYGLILLNYVSSVKVGYEHFRYGKSWGGVVTDSF